jgi:hypothetical protein
MDHFPLGRGPTSAAQSYNTLSREDPRGEPFTEGVSPKAQTLIADGCNCTIFSCRLRYSVCPMSRSASSVTLDSPSPAPILQATAAEEATAAPEEAATAPEQPSRMAARVFMPLLIAVAVLITVAWVVVLVSITRSLITTVV